MDHRSVKTIPEILAASSITESDARYLLAEYPGIGELLATVAAKRFATSRTVTTRPFTPADIVQNWSNTLDRVVVGLVFHEASGIGQVGHASVSIDKRSGKMIVSDW